MTYYIYHVEGIKFGCTNDPKRRAKQTLKRYGKVKFEVVEEFEDIGEASRREIELNERYDTADRKPYSDMVAMREGTKYHTGEQHHNFGQDVAGDKNPNYGNAWSEEQRRHLSQMNSNPSEDTRSKMRAAWIGREKIACPHCGKESISRGNMNRWHFDNCKSA
jgi:predicted RNA-binding Zn-ribbon protein involved in translation (DUF1610 family)